MNLAGSLSSSMDLTINPCDDFYKYSCGKWQDDHPFPRNVDGWSHFIKLSYEMRKSMLSMKNIPSFQTFLIISIFFKQRTWKTEQ